MEILKKEKINDEMFYDIKLTSGELMAIIDCTFLLYYDIEDVYASKKLFKRLLCKDAELLFNHARALCELFHPNEHKAE
ncbi:hypothetical protein J8V57_19900 [Xenorhabdus sp. PB61.4]|uniref:hypothetical protein n=1 Tax=Xenorhabdus sp. PB61.4 TaxID=2788940 RepID=UPI001E39558A|nr:hypothetical protein [Xenorhabdus sp. PB61.4]MCC8368450.1 hypothetical protein [Xenorhabdus sp. PB61.4]